MCRADMRRHYLRLPRQELGHQGDHHEDPRRQRHHHQGHPVVVKSRIQEAQRPGRARVVANSALDISSVTFVEFKNLPPFQEACL